MAHAQPLLDGDTEMSNSSTNGLPLESPDSPFFHPPQSILDTSTPTTAAFPPDSSLPDGDVPPPPTPAPGVNTSAQQQQQPPALAEAANLAAADLANPTHQPPGTSLSQPAITTGPLPSNITTSTSQTPTKPQSPAPSTASALPAGLNSPARGGTPVPGAATSNLPPSAIIPSKYGEVGSPTRVYINSKVTPVLLEGMRWIAKNEPEKPLKWLGEFLLRRSGEVEGT